METQTPVGIRERRDPGPRAHKPEPLDGIDDREEQHQEKNSYQNQGGHSVKKRIWLDAVCVRKGSANAPGIGEVSP